MTKVGEKLKGFGIGLSLAGIAVLSSGGGQAAQGLCPGTCQSCFGCGIAAVPLILWMAASGRKRFQKLERLAGSPTPDPAQDFIERTTS